MLENGKLIIKNQTWLLMVLTYASQQLLPFLCRDLAILMPELDQNTVPPTLFEGLRGCIWASRG